MSWRKGGTVVCLCMDGTPYLLFSYLLKKGALPNFAKLVERGTFLETISSVPEVSNVAWTTIFTGCNPAEHGIFGFTDLHHYSYKIKFPSFLDVQVPAVWERLSENKRRSIIINVPATYPAKPLVGKLVSGFVAIDLKKACWPKDWADELERIGYVIDVDVSEHVGKKEELIKALEKSIEARGRVILDLFEREDFDLFWAVISETDRLHHFLFDAAMDESHPLHDAFVGIYRKIDELFGEILKCLDGRATFFAFSDHGFTNLEREVNINYWLQEKGYLKFENSLPKSLEDISADSAAFALDPARIYLNVKGRFPKGSVEPDEKAYMLGKLIEGLKKIEAQDGRQVISHIFKGDEIYSGPLIDKAPDLVLIGRKGFDLKSRISSETLFSKSHFTGMHTRDDAFFLTSERRDIKQPFEIVQIYSFLAEKLGI